MLRSVQFKEHDEAMTTKSYPKYPIKKMRDRKKRERFSVQPMKKSKCGIM